MHIFSGIFITNLAVFFIIGQIHTVADVGVYVIGFLPGMGLVIAVAYFLKRHWERKEGIEDEK